MSEHLRFGVWAPVYGTWASFHHPEEPVDASWDRTSALIRDAERLGYETALIAQHLINPFGEQHDQLETWTATAALAALTERIELIAAVKPYLHHPVVLAKQAAQIEEISRGRFGINLVNAWYKPELERAGIGFAEHDQRYAYGAEWLHVVRGLLAGQRVDFRGEHFRVEDYRLRPTGTHRPRPAIYVGGESEPARQLAAAQADTWFLNGQPLDDVRALVDDGAARPRGGDPLRFALSAFAIARETDAEAQEVLQHQWELAERDKATWEGLVADADPKAVMFRTFARNPHIGTNGGTAAGLVGSYDTVAKRILEFRELGIGTLMLQFQPFEAEQRRFAAEVIPRYRELAGEDVST